MESWLLRSVLLWYDSFMKSLGIIAEFNPFHQGHQYLIHQAIADTDAEVCVVVMSGNFVQRGLPAVYDKWARAEEAVKQGANLVVELPTVFACNSAEYFAKGGVSVLEGFGCIDYLAFGSEHGDLAEIQKAAAFLKSNDSLLTRRIQTLLKEGLSHPKAREIAVLELEKDFDEDLIKEPNNILAIEYLKQIERMQPYTVKRQGAGYHQAASVIRKEMEVENPAYFTKIRENYWHLTASKILQMDLEQLSKVFSADQGLANKIKKEIRYASSADELIDRVKSKVYTRSRISRFLTHILLDIDGQAVPERAEYIRVLAFNQTGSRFLKSVKKAECNRLPILTNINKEAANYPEIRKGLDMDICASDIYNLITGRNLYDYSDYVMRPYVKL